MTNKSKVMYIVLLECTYGYLCTNIRSVTPTGDLNKYESGISTSMRTRLLYEFMKNYDICYLLLLYVYYK